MWHAVEICRLQAGEEEDVEGEGVDFRCRVM